jgi:photosystem II stability/assembly factor-like uncharacterized protein
MKTHLAFAALAVCLAAEPSRAITADEILAKNLEARGGEANVAGLRSLRLTGKIIFGFGDTKIEAGFGQVQKRSLHFRREVSLQGLTAVDAYDGNEGWSLEPFFGRRDARRSSADEARALAQDADIEGHLVHAKDKGHKVEYLGTEDVDGTPAHKLRVSLKDGDVEYVFLDPDTFLEIRIVTERHVRGAEQVTETDYGSYAQAGGVWVPMAVESGRRGAPKNVRVQIETAEANVDFDDGLFRWPTGPIARAVVAGAKVPAPAAAAPRSKAAAAPVLDAGVLSGLGARNIGAAIISGRIASVAAVNQDGKTQVYVGAASGGVWKSLDGGTTFKPVFDKMPVQSIGAVAIDPSNPRTIWVGTGESWTRNSVSVGDGIYKSTDAGESWTNMGLPQSERVVRIIVHPKNSDVVYACVPGKLWSDSSDRGVYKTSDGGKTWSLLLRGENLSTGCSGLSMDPGNPDVLFAGMWDFRRKGWTFRSGGENAEAVSGSGLFRSADGGRTWSEVPRQGLPAKPWGRVEVAVAPSDAKIVYAVIESEKSALFRSSDGGKTWEARDKSNPMVWRLFYFARLVIDPTNPERLFKPGLNLVVSEDGGRSFSNTGGKAHGDWHDVWIDPQNPKHIIGGDDGGLWISYDGGNRWVKSINLPVAQFYHVAVDDHDPYRVYGGLQDNSSWVGDSAYPGGITNSRWENLYGGDGFWVVPDPTDPDATYAEAQGGYIGRVDRKTLATRDIQPKARFHEKLRFNWNTPIHASLTQKGVIYLGSQFLFRSRDRGDSWERISPDLTSNDPEKQKQEQSGGITVDNSSAEMHTTIYSVSESPLDSQVIWVGTDDGNVQLTRDGGKNWTDVTTNVTGLPRASWVSWVEASRFEPGTAYAAFDRHTYGDMDPWVYRTTDFGRTWARIISPESGVRGYAHVIKEDSVKKSLLFAGTEMGLWISLDSGKSWAQFKGGEFPSVAVRDVQVQAREGDLVLGTHGRGIWIVDDLTPLRALTTDMLSKDAVFLPGRPVQQRMAADGGWAEGDSAFTGENPPSGAVITYYQRSRHLFGPIKIEVLDAQGKVVDTIPASKRRGINRVSWTMQVAPPRVPRAASIAFAGSQGPRVAPGTYTVRLTKGTQVFETKMEVGLDRRAPYTVADRKSQLDAAMRVHALFGDMSSLVDRLDAARGGAEARLAQLPTGDDLREKLRALSGKVEAVKKKVVATKEGGAITGEERIREHTDQLYGALLRWEGKPAGYQVERIDVLKKELEEVRGEFEALVTSEVRPLDSELRKRKLEPIPSTVGVSAQADLPGELREAALECVREKACEVERAAAARERD